jgi:hypothetical protein
MTSRYFRSVLWPLAPAATWAWNAANQFSTAPATGHATVGAGAVVAGIDLG